MYNKQDLISCIKEIGIKPTDTLLVHSSMKAIGMVEHGANCVIDAFIDYMKDGLLIFPTHTWANITKNGDVYDPETEPSCVGILSNIFLKREGVFRSLHPTHSVAAKGKNAEEYVNLDISAKTPTPEKGCFGVLSKLDAKVLFLGCDLSKNTFIHSIEELCNIPNRLSSQPINIKIKIENNIMEKQMIIHQAPINDISVNYGKLLTPFLENNIAVRGFIGDAESLLCNAKGMGEVAYALLKKDNDYFLKPTFN